jgi:hypothetical protein
MTPINKEEMKAWVERGKLVNQITLEEAMRMSPEERMRSLDQLYVFGRSIGFGPRAEEDDRETWEAWRVIREKFYG